MTSAVALWWLALPVLLLPLWWHRQKRQRTLAEPLATARFLPAAAPQALRVWRWADRLLLAVRLLLLLAVIAWLADVVVPWRGDTVFVGAGAEPTWVEAQIQAAGLAAAQRTVYCAADAATAAAIDHDVPPPAPARGCDLHTDDLLAWLAAHEREWRPAARLAVVGPGDAVRMTAHPPALAHRVDLRLQPAQAASATREHRVVLASARPAAWRALFKAFEGAGRGGDRFVITDEPDARTALIVWDRPDPPDAAWHAPLWWAVQPDAFPELAHARRTGGVRVADGARGRVWAPDTWPLDERDPLPAARALYEDRGGLLAEPLPYAAPTTTLPATVSQAAVQPTGAAHAWLAPCLAVLFALERGLAHRLARRVRGAAVASSAGTTVATGPQAARP